MKRWMSFFEGLPIDRFVVRLLIMPVNGASEVSGVADVVDQGGRNGPTLRWGGRATGTILNRDDVDSVPVEGDKGFIVSRAIIDQSAEALDRAPHD